MYESNHPPDNMIHPTLPTLAALAGIALASSAHAAITTYTYTMGEGFTAGSTVTSLTCAEDSAKNLTGLTNGIAGFTAVAPALGGAPGSTMALSDTNNNGSIYATTDVFGSITGDFAFQFYFNPGTTGGTYVGASNNNNDSSGAGLLFHATNTGKLLMRNDNVGSQTIASLNSYSTGTWYQLTGIVYGGNVNYYIDGVLQGSVDKSTWGTTILGKPIIGAGSFASSGTTGQFDQMKILTFDSGVDSLASVQSSLSGAFAAVPEPSAYGLLGAGALVFAAMVRRRRKSA